MLISPVFRKLTLPSVHNYPTKSLLRTNNVLLWSNFRSVGFHTWWSLKSCNFKDVPQVFWFRKDLRTSKFESTTLITNRKRITASHVSSEMNLRLNILFRVYQMLRAFRKTFGALGTMFICTCQSQCALHWHYILKWILSPDSSFLSALTWNKFLCFHWLLCTFLSEY